MNKSPVGVPPHCLQCLLALTSSIIPTLSLLDIRLGVVASQATYSLLQRYMCCNGRHKTPPECAAQALLAFLPLMVGYFALNVPSGLSLYYFANTVITSGQQIWLRKLGGAALPHAHRCAPGAASGRRLCSACLCASCFLDPVLTPYGLHFPGLYGAEAWVRKPWHACALV